MARKIDRGQPLAELVKGSLEYTQNAIRRSFEKQFADPTQVYVGSAFYIVDTFAEAVIAAEMGPGKLKTDEYYRVTYQRTGEDYVFAPREEWEVVELTYQPQTTPEAAAPAAEPAPVAEAAGFPIEALGNDPASGKRRGKRFVERMTSGGLVLEEAAKDGGDPAGPRMIRAERAMTANIINGNDRRYPAQVLREAVEKMRTHLNESAGQGRMQYLGEVDHPSDKGGRPNMLDTVVKWDSVNFDGDNVSVAGHLLETAKGKDIQALARGGVQIPLSMRGYGDSRMVSEAGREIEEVTRLEITGFDLVLEPGFEEAATIIESQKNQNSGDEDMDPEKLKELIKANPDLFKDLIKEDLSKMGEEQMKALEEQVRKALGIDEKADLGKALTEAMEAKKTLEAQTKAKTIDEAISAATKDMPYGEKMNAMLIESVKAANPQDAPAVKALVEARRKEYDAMAAEARLAAMGRVNVLGPVLETELGIPEYARGAHEVTEALAARGFAKRINWKEPKSINEIFAAQVLKRFDEGIDPRTKVPNRVLLEREAKLLNEAEQVTNLSLPTTVSRSIIAAVWPTLIATSVFDTGTVDASPFRLYYENYAVDSPSPTQTATNETVTADLNAYVDLAYKRVTPGTVTVTDSDGTPPTYVEGTDYVIDYANGKIMALATITDGQTIKVTYTYQAIRKGEMAAIPRAMGQLSYKTMEAMADRLAMQVSNEAILFSRSQIGWDATARTLDMLVRQIRTKIDQGLFYLALASVLQVASNSGGTWTAASDELSELVADIGVARVLVQKRYWEPTAVLMSITNSDVLANSEMFTAAGARPDASLTSNGFVGSVKGLPCFASTEFPDGYVLVLNRELVAYRIFQAMAIRGPFPSYDSNGYMLAADQYYAEEYNVSDSPIVNKGAYVKIA
jgi:hypothetical protein